MITKIKKRDGQIVPFDQNKIVKLYSKPLKRWVRVTRPERNLSNQVVKIYEENYQGIPTVEIIQDIVEKSLIENGHAKTAKAYILYRQQRTGEITSKLNAQFS